MRSVFQPSLLCLVLAAALSTLASDADARRLIGGRPIGEQAAETGTDASPVAKVETSASSGLTSALSGGDMKRSVVTGVTAGIAAGTMRNAAADARESAAAGSISTSQSPSSPSLTSPASPASLNSIAATEARLRKMDTLAEREKSRDSATRPIDSTAETPVVKTAAERRREQKEAEEKAELDRKEDARRIQLAKEASCRIEPVMSDIALATCRQVWRSL